MSSIWTPDGEQPVGRGSQAPAGGASGGAQGRQPAGFTDSPAGQSDGEAAAQAANQAQMEELRQQLADTPADVVVANHCFGLFELAALHLSLEPAKLGEAQLAIDALAALVENLTGRLGEAEPHLREGLNQLRMAFVQIRQRADG